MKIKRFILMVAAGSGTAGCWGGKLLKQLWVIGFAGHRAEATVIMRRKHGGRVFSDVVCGCVALTLVLNLMGAGTAKAGTSEVSALLQKGLFEEEANRNLDAAIEAYQSVITQTEKDHQFAATAIFRLGECYRKQGKTNEANIQYQRILREFPDQAELVKLSQEYAGASAAVSAASNQAGAPGMQGRVAAVRAEAESYQRQIEELKSLSLEKRRVFAQQHFPNPVLNSLMQDAVKAEQDLAKLKSNLGSNHPDVQRSTAELKTIYEQTDAQVDGVLIGLVEKKNTAAATLAILEKWTKEAGGSSAEGSSISVEAASKASSEANEIKRLQAMIKDSPDLINGRENGQTPLHKAVIADHFVVAKFLLDNKADTEAIDNYARTPLLLAAQSGRKEMVDLLLERGANVNAAAIKEKVASRYMLNSEENGRTPLHYAALYGYKGVAEALLAHGAKVEARNEEGKTPLHYAAQKGFKNVAEILLAGGADINAKDNSGATALFEAVGAGNKAIVELLLANKADVNATDNNGATALFLTADTGYPAVAEMLIAHKADMNIKTKQGMTALMEAVAQNQPDVAEMLLAHGADARIQQPRRENGSGGWGALHFAVHKNSAEMIKILLKKGAEVDAVARVIATMNMGNGESAYYHDFTPLMMAISSERLELAQMLLAEKANVNFQNEKRETPLLVAVTRGSKEMVGLLLKNKADVNMLDERGWSLLHHAVSVKNRDIAELLLAHGADPKQQVPKHVEYNGGWTALHFAAAQRQTDVAELLLNGGADINALSANGDSPLQVAIKYGSNVSAEIKPMVELLLARGADVNLVDNQGKAALDLFEANSKNEVAELLRQHGAVSVLERGTIRITRSGQTAPAVVFRRDAHGYNHHKLFEVLGYIYPDQLGLAYWSQTTGGNRQPELPGYYFPDFARIKIRRPVTGEAGERTSTISSDWEAALNAGDCSANLPLNWGDIVELPELDHNVSENWSGLSEAARNTLKKCLERHIKIIVKGRETRLTLAPNLAPNNAQTVLTGPPPIGELQPASASTSSPKTELAKFWLSDVVRDARVILASSDLTQIKVRRKDAKTGKTGEMVFNLDKIDARNDLWLEDGDVIEIPEKQ